MTAFPWTYAISFQDQARFHICFTGKTGKFIGRDGRLKIGQGISNEQWLFLPALL